MNEVIQFNMNYLIYTSILLLWLVLPFFLNMGEVMSVKNRGKDTLWILFALIVYLPLFVLALTLRAILFILYKLVTLISQLTELITRAIQNDKTSKKP